MLDRLGRMNGACHQQVLPEVFTLGGATLFIAVMQAGHKLHFARVALAEACPVTQVNRQAAQGAHEGAWVEAELAGEEPVEFY